MVIGSGGREHAISWKLAQSPALEKVYCSQGNAGTALEERVENISFNNFEETIKFIKENSVELIVIGPEKPLAEGAADLFREQGIKVFGFGKKEALLESSKVFARNFCTKYKVSCPRFEVFEDSSAAISFLEENRDKRFFVKADELCGGKGALPAPTFEEGERAVVELMIEKKCGKGKEVLIEEWVEGEELTIMAFTDGKTISIMPTSQDHKRLLDGDNGPNTGGMGAYSPAPLFDEEVEKNFRKKILEPTLEGMKKEGFDSPGVIYFGLIVDKEKNPFLLEYNVRFGDPEAQPVLMLLESDLFKILSACCDRRLKEIEKSIQWSKGNALCVTLAVKGYPVNYGNEREQITGIREAESIEGVKVFHAGTTLENHVLLTAGGRILSVTAIADSLKEAKLKAYSAIKKIRFNGMHFRSDIGGKAIGD